MKNDEIDSDGLVARISGKWTSEKHFYLQRYIEIFETSMKLKFQKRNYIDLFAGSGRNYLRETKTFVDGSPLIALNAQNPFTGYIFIEKSKRRITALQSRCENRFHDRVFTFYLGDCNIKVDEVIKYTGINQALNLAFIDPDGLEVNWSTIEKLASIKRMDMIINYSEGGINRAIGKFVKSENSDCLSQYFGTVDWKEIYADYQRKKNFNLHRSFIDLIMTKLEKLGYVSVESIQVNMEPLIRNSKRNAPQYRLLFASKHELGNNFWKKITDKDNHGQSRLPMNF
jgi:three-Cys-motif partner protein